MPEPWLPPFVHPPAPAEHPPSRPPRSRRVRVALTAVADLLAAGLLYVRIWTDEQLPPAFTAVPHLDLYGLCTSLVVMAFLWWVLPKVSYRRRDALLTLVPFVGVWLVGMAVWRLSALPYRDWRPRDDELPNVRVVPGTPLHVLEPSAAAPAGARAASTMHRPGRSAGTGERP